jgi:hypothetical protein
MADDLRESGWEAFLSSEMQGILLCSGRNRYPSLGALADALAEFPSRGFVILGIEGLATDGVNLMPSLEHIADFSSIEGTRAERVARSVAAARSLLDRWRGQVPFVDVAVDDGM